ncbi:TIGR04372 family glycosyltransferase [Prochlorococcus sp. AH-716-K03]|nr:TIGR04372 family glycosyltransferase [Prochlorococcus sp. AH-716-K03]
MKLLNLPYFYDRAYLINKILKIRKIKDLYLLILIKLISRLFKNRIDYFDVSILLNGIYDQYKLNKKEVNVNFQPLSEGLYTNYSSRRIDQNIKLYKNLLKIPQDKRTYQFQSKLNILEYKLNGLSEEWYKFKKILIQLSSDNYPDSNKEEMFLGPNWYEGIGHIALLGYLARAYPNKFTLLIVDGAKVANIRLLNAIKSELKIIKCSPLIFNSLLISQPSKIFQVDDTKFCDQKDPVIDLINKGIKKTINTYKLDPNILNLRDILDSKQIDSHNLNKEYVTLHVRSSPNEKSNSKESGARNADILSYIESIKFLINNDINVVRIGDQNSPKLPYINGFIDLTLKERDHNKDIELLANAKFHIATVSGPVNVPPLFGVPVLLTNSVRPHIQPIYPLSLSINKRCFNKKDKDYLSYDSFIKANISKEEMKRDFGEFILIDNSPEEILLAVKDMLRLTNYDSIESKKREYEKICLEHKKYLKSKSLEYLDPHIPIAPSFLNNID